MELETPLTQAGLDELTIQPLSNAATEELLEATSGPPDLDTLRQLISEAEGKPLALMELPKTLTTDQQRGRDSLSQGRPLTRRLETVLAARLDELSENSRWLLLLCALDRTGLVVTINAAGRSWWFPISGPPMTLASF